MGDNSSKTPEASSDAAGVSRREMIRKSLTGAAVAAGSTVLGGWGPRAEGEYYGGHYGESAEGEFYGERYGESYARGKVSKAAAHYQYHPNGPQHCAVCQHFRGPDHCEVVAGRIVPDGWCRYFRSAGGRGGYGGYGGHGGGGSRGY